MTKTAKQIIGDVMEILSGDIITSISGKAYRSGLRPKGSKLEDLVVIFTTGTTRQVQEGVITLNIYVPDVQIDSETYVENVRRCEEVEVLAQEWVSSLDEVVEYDFELQQTIYTEIEEELKQHFVVVKLRYKLLTD